MWSALVEVAEHAGRQYLGIKGNQNILHLHVSADCGPHAEGVPFPGECHSRGVSCDGEVKRPFFPGAVIDQQGWGRVILSRARERNEKFATIHKIAVVNSLGASAEPPSPNGQLIAASGLDWFAVRLAIENAILNHLSESLRAQFFVSLVRFRRQIDVLHECVHHHHGEAVHIKGKRGRGVAPGDLFRHQAVGLEVCAEATVFFGDAEGKEAFCV